MTVQPPTPLPPAPPPPSALLSTRALVVIVLAVAAGVLAAHSTQWAVGLATGTAILLGFTK